MSNSQIIQTERNLVAQAAANSAVGVHRASESPLVLVQRYLRGRYVLAGILGVILSVPFAVAGYYAVPPVYQSTGIVKVAAIMPKTLYKTDENQMMPMFDSFVSTQAQFLQGRRVMDFAVERPELLAAGWPAGVDGVALLGKKLEVRVPRGSELVYVTVSHVNPVLAQVAVNAVLQAYDLLKDDLNGQAVRGREQLLDDRQKALRKGLESLRRRSLDLALEFGTDDLEPLRQARFEVLEQLDASLSQLNVLIEQAKGASPARAEGVADVRVLAERDPRLKEMLDEEEKLQIEIANASAKLSPAHRTLIEKKQGLSTLQAAIRKRAASVSSGPGVSGMQYGPGASVEQLEAERAARQLQRDKAADELKRIGATRLNILSLREEAEDAKRELDETASRLKEIQVEKDNTKKGRITIAQTGDRPVAPSTDRRIPLALFGALLGLGLGGGLVWGYGFLWDGYRHADDLEVTGLTAPLLGIIPDLAKPSPGDEENAALSVHHLRNTLQLQTDLGDSRRGRLYTVTSSSAGEGKTHLALALGMSFAMSGRRTLLIDADLVGRALTSQLSLKSSKGLSEAVGARTLNGEVHAVQPNLWALPVGIAADFRAEQLSSSMMTKLLDQAREAFDTIIIDSGPIMGSLEANLASSLSDRVVMVVARGQDSKAVRAALNRLRNIGATCAGLVFNRALSKDFARSVSAMSLSGRTSRRSKADADGASTALARVLGHSKANPGHGGKA